MVFLNLEPKQGLSWEFETHSRVTHPYDCELELIFVAGLKINGLLKCTAMGALHNLLLNLLGLLEGLARCLQIVSWS